MFKYSVGPWNVHEGADAYGPATRETISFEDKIKQFKEIGFDAIQFHDDDAVPNMNNMTEAEIIEEAKKVKALLDKYDLKAEFVAPRLWMDPHTIDGGLQLRQRQRIRYLESTPFHRHRKRTGMRQNRSVAGKRRHHLPGKQEPR